MPLDQVPGKLPYPVGRTLTTLRVLIRAKRSSGRGICQPLLSSSTIAVSSRTKAGYGNLTVDDPRASYDQQYSGFTSQVAVCTSSLFDTTPIRSLFRHSVVAKAYICRTLLIAKGHKADTDINACLSDLDDRNANNPKDRRDPVVLECLRDEVRAGHCRSQRHAADQFRRLGAIGTVLDLNSARLDQYR